MGDPISAKATLRSELRQRRREVIDDGRSERICAALTEVVDEELATTVMVFDALPGEPDLTSFVSWCRARGTVTVAPPPDPVAVDPIAPASVDVVVVPGLAFTRDGRRLGQGGGWYDRFLARVRTDCLKIGVAYDVQIVDDVPTEAHDERLDLVVTESGRVERAAGTS